MKYVTITLSLQIPDVEWHEAYEDLGGEYCYRDEDESEEEAFRRDLEGDWDHTGGCIYLNRTTIKRVTVR